jgi:hypothetical protein
MASCNRIGNPEVIWNNQAKMAASEGLRQKLLERSDDLEGGSPFSSRTKTEWLSNSLGDHFGERRPYIRGRVEALDNHQQPHKS